jgi:hypothetical protein
MLDSAHTTFVFLSIYVYLIQRYGIVETIDEIPWYLAVRNSRHFSPQKLRWFAITAYGGHNGASDAAGTLVSPLYPHQLVSSD